MDSNTAWVLMTLIVSVCIVFCAMVWAATRPTGLEPSPEPTMTTTWRWEYTYDNDDDDWGECSDEIQEYRDRLAAALWRNRQLARENRTLAATGQQFLRDYTKAHTRCGELEREVSDLRAALRVARGQLADVAEIKQRMELWTGEL